MLTDIYLFAITEPPLKLVLLGSQPGEATRMDHLGVEVETTDLVNTAHHRLADAGLATRPEDETTCCYAVQDKVWVTGPGEEPWEVTPSKPAPARTSKVRPASNLSEVTGDCTCCTDDQPAATDNTDDSTNLTTDKQPAAACC